MKRPTDRLMLVIGILLLAGCATNRFEHPRTGMKQQGIASWYGDDFHGKPTASGEIYDMYAMTAAHKELPLGSRVEVRNLENGKTVRVKVNDRGPFIKGRIIDLSLSAARAIDMVAQGTVRVEVEVLDVGQGKPGPTHTSSYTIQAGAFRSHENAKALQAKLRRHFSDVRIATENGLHRVRVGRVKTRAEAGELRSQIRAQGFEAEIIALD